MVLDHPSQCFLLNQRYVTAQNDDFAVKAVKRFLNAQNSMPCAKLLLLDHPKDVFSCVSPLNCVRAMPNDDRHNARIQPPRSSQGMKKKRFSPEVMEHLRQRRFHPGTLPCG